MGGRLLEVGRVLRPHGLGGDVVVELVTDRTERLAPGARLASDLGELVVHRAVGLPGRGGGGPPVLTRWLVAFEGVGDRDRAGELRGCVLRAEAQEGEPGTLWVHEMIGSEVRDRAGRVLGWVREVEANPASDLLVLEGGELVPLRFVVEQEPGFLVAELPDGLLEAPEGLRGAPPFPPAPPAPAAAR